MPLSFMTFIRKLNIGVRNEKGYNISFMFNDDYIWYVCL